MKPTFRNIGLILAIIGIVLFLLSPDILAWMKKPIDFYGEDTVVTDIKKGDRVSIAIDTVYDYFATETTVDENTGHIISSEGTTYFYLIPGYVLEDEGYRLYYFAVKANTKTDSDIQKTLSKIMKNTQAYMNYETDDPGDTVLELDAYCMKLDEELTELMYDYFRELDYPESDIQTYVLPYCLRELRVGYAKGMLIASSILFVIGMTLFISMIVSIKKENNRIKNQTEVIINGVAYPKEMFAGVQHLVRVGNPKAVTDLMELTGLPQEEAANVIRNWGKYYYF